MVDNIKQTNILLCGSSRVGKSTLIDAICQQKLSKTNRSLNSVTKSIEQYSYKCTNGRTTHETIIWDTPGIESWNENEVRSYMISLIEQTQPLCMIYCASPGSFARLEHVSWLVSECYEKNIFCALVCTNMWAGRNRQGVVDEFCRILNSIHPNIHPIEEDNVIYFNNVALVTMVNSHEYIDKDFDVIKPVSGIEQLIFGIGKSLNRDLMFAWFRTVSQNTNFWTNMSSKLSHLFQMPTGTLTSLYGHASNFLDFLFDDSNFLPDDDDMTPLTTKDTEECLFHDAEIIDLPEQKISKKLIFTFQLDDIARTIEFPQILQKLGAKSCKTEELNKESEHLLKFIVEFEDIEHAEAMYHFWQLTTTNQINCTIVDELSDEFSNINSV
ncbi:unnamed protein product [Adineta steineri]|uniref:G domain-containing protein n=1 Tax=Adineta steineri TaxID=433720 RepID=A0A814QQM7_9BILA|nr:unnamed protein product [Adineta steineri]CAF1123548.1 unnamed protein product [Adineta steineri]